MPTILLPSRRVPDACCRDGLTRFPPIPKNRGQHFAGHGISIAAKWCQTVDAAGQRVKRYYPMDSVGIASDMLIAALHHAGLATLTHTPSPMAFLNEILGRPDNERPFSLLVVGYPAEGARVPNISRKPLEAIARFVE